MPFLQDKDFNPTLNFVFKYKGNINQATFRQSMRRPKVIEKYNAPEIYISEFRMHSMQKIQRTKNELVQTSTMAFVVALVYPCHLA